MSSDNDSASDSEQQDSSSEENESVSYHSSENEEDEKTDEEQEEDGDGVNEAVEEEEDIKDILEQIETAEAVESYVLTPEEEEEAKRMKFKRKFGSDRFPEDRERLMPPVSQEHLALVDTLVADIMQDLKLEHFDEELIKVMKAVDFKLFYERCTFDWARTNALMLFNTMAVLKHGLKVLSLPLNMYFNVCLSLLVGQEGSVVCFGTEVNINMLDKNGILWLYDDQRLVIINEHSYYYADPCYVRFLDLGFVYMQPYDLVILSVNSENGLNDAIRKQMCADGVCFNPYNGVQVT